MRVSRGSTTDDIANVLVRGDALTVCEDKGWREDTVRKLAALHVRFLAKRHPCPDGRSEQCTDPQHGKDVADMLTVLDALDLPRELPVLADDESDVWGRSSGEPET